MFYRKLFKLKEMHEAIPTAWGLAYKFYIIFRFSEVNLDEIRKKLIAETFIAGFLRLNFARKSYKRQNFDIRV